MLTLCHRHLSESLRFVNDLPTLSEVRTSLLKVIAASAEMKGMPLGRSVDLWTELFQSIFLKQLEVSLCFFLT